MPGLLFTAATGDVDGKFNSTTFLSAKSCSFIAFVNLISSSTNVFVSTAWSTATFSPVTEKGKEKAVSCPSSSQQASLPAEDAFILQQYELHNLVLVDHMDRNVARLGLGSEQSGSKYNGHTLSGHAVGISVVNHPGGEKAVEDQEIYRCKAS